VSATAGEFLDSNILVYAFTTDPRAAAAQVLLERGGIVSVKGLNEFTNVARRKLGMTWGEVRDSLRAIRTLAGTVLRIDIDTHADGLRIAERHTATVSSIALMIASALRADWGTSWSDM
jgi:predicted nucleic acid-binding protein